MELRINKEVYQALRGMLQRKPYRVTDLSLSWRDWTSFNPDELTTRDLEQLAKSLRKLKNVRGAKSLAQDITAFVATRRGVKGGQLQANSVRMAVHLMRCYLHSLKRQWLYNREDGPEGTTLAYYVEEVDFHEATKYSSETMVLTLYYEIFGEIRRHFEYFSATECLRRTAAQTLLAKCYQAETPELLQGYQEDLADYVGIQGRIGGEYLASGIVDDGDVDGNSDVLRERWFRNHDGLRIGTQEEPARVVLDSFYEDGRKTPEENRGKRWTPSGGYWATFNPTKGGPDEVRGKGYKPEQLESCGEVSVDVPVHPYVVGFDLKRGFRFRIHVHGLEPYVYNTGAEKNLVLEPVLKEMLDTLLVESDATFSDLVRDKGSGTIVLAQGPPGIGKTLTAEIYAEVLHRPLYSVQCSQLTTNPNELETNLLKVFERALRWNAIALLDEADVYIMTRGSDLTQNAVVGVFLRVLEQFKGLLFMTTNREDLVDDAILSRCTLLLPYRLPDAKQQARIWGALAKVNKLPLSTATIKQLVRAFPHLTGRDIRDYLKLSLKAISARGGQVGVPLIKRLAPYKPAAYAQQLARQKARERNRK